MALIQAFFDDSGSHDGSKYFVVGGYMATFPKWELLSAEWWKGVNFLNMGWFHMAEVEKMSGHEGDLRNAYGWDWRLRDAALSEFGKLVRAIHPIGVACVVDVADWERYVKSAMAVSPRFLQEAGFPYHEAYTGCLAQMSIICEKMGVPLEDVKVVFAEQKRDGPRARESVRRIHENFGLSDPVFDNMQKSAPLQCADALAWLVNKKSREGESFIVRPRYKDFLEGLWPALKLDEYLLQHYGQPMPKLSELRGFLSIPGTLGELPPPPQT